MRRSRPPSRPRRPAAPSCAAGRSPRTRSCTPGRGRSCSTSPTTWARAICRRICDAASTSTPPRPASRRSSSSSPGSACSPPATRWAQADTARHIYLDALRVGEGALRLGGVRALDPAERTFIEEWEAEAYRRQVVVSSGRPGRAAGKVAVVTGAAQGFGLAIADGPRRAGRPRRPRRRQRGAGRGERRRPRGPPRPRARDGGRDQRDGRGVRRRRRSTRRSGAMAGSTCWSRTPASCGPAASPPSRSPTSTS